MFCQPIGREVSSVEIKMGLIMGGKPAVAGTIEVRGRRLGGTGADTVKHRDRERKPAI